MERPAMASVLAFTALNSGVTLLLRMADGRKGRVHIRKQPNSVWL